MVGPETQPLVDRETESGDSARYGTLESRRNSSAGDPKGEREFAFARPGVLPRPKEGDVKLSRDGSVHVTDEVRTSVSSARGWLEDRRTAHQSFCPPRRPQVFNTASHFTALMLSILGSAVLIVKASIEVGPTPLDSFGVLRRTPTCSRRAFWPAQAEPWKIVGFSIYGACLMALFAASTLHHGLEGHEGMEKGLRIADFCAIFPLIAGAGHTDGAASRRL